MSIAIFCLNIQQRLFFKTTKMDQTSKSILFHVKKWFIAICLIVSIGFTVFRLTNINEVTQEAMKDSEFKPDDDLYENEKVKHFSCGAIPYFYLAF